MARGWESKSVEAQQEAADRRPQTAAEVKAGEAAVATERATLLLARARALADLQRACVAAHRGMLERALADLDARLEALNGRGAPRR